LLKIYGRWRVLTHKLLNQKDNLKEIKILKRWKSMVKKFDERSEIRLKSFSDFNSG
jgi:hypothetical protein